MAGLAEVEDVLLTLKVLRDPFCRFITESFYPANNQKPCDLKIHIKKKDNPDLCASCMRCPEWERPGSQILRRSVFAGLRGAHQRRQRQAGLPHEAGRADPRPCAPAAQQGTLLLPSPQDRRAQTQVCAWLHR